MGKHNYNNSGKIQKNAAYTIDTIVQVSGSQKNENAGYFPKDGSHKYYGFPFRKWTTAEKLIVDLLALSVIIYGGHDILKKNKSTKKYMDNLDSALGGAFDSIYNQISGIPGYDNNPVVNFRHSDSRIVPANASAAAGTQVSETPYQFKPGIEFFGSEQYKQKIQKALDEIKRTNITEYNEVMLYWETIDEKNVEGHGYLAEKDISPSNLIHDKEHIKQANIEPWKSYYEGKSGWFNELDAVKKQVDWEAEAYNYSDERKQQQIKNYMDYYKERYPEQYAKWISED